MADDIGKMLLPGNIRIYFLQHGSIACYAERYISYDRFCLTDHPIVRLSHAGIMPKRLKLGSCSLHWRVAPL